MIDLPTNPGWRPTLDRDVRINPDQLIYATHAVRARVRQLSRSIETANRNQRAGNKIQAGVYEGHLRERQQLEQLLEAFEVARRQIAFQITNQLSSAAVA